MCNFFAFDRQIQQSNQFINGLESHGVFSLLKRYSLEAIKEFTYDPESLTADTFSSLYKFEFSEEKERKVLEQDIAFQWRQFIDMVEAKQFKKFGLQDVLHFLTGSRYQPPTRFKRNGEIICEPCDDKNIGRRIVASTCFLTLRIPLTERYMKDDFADHVIEDIRQSPGFGRI